MPPVAEVRRIEPPMPEPVLEDSPLQDHERALRDFEEMYRTGRLLWGHEFGVAWAAWAAGIIESGQHKPWTMREIRQLVFLRWAHRRDRLS